MNNLPFTNVCDTEMLDTFRNNYSNTIPPNIETHNDQLAHKDSDLNILVILKNYDKSKCAILNNLTRFHSNICSSAKKHNDLTYF